MKQYQLLENPALVQAFAHPLRARIFYVLQERAASPKELSAELNTPLANIAYHIQVLRKLKLIKLVKKTPRRGAIEHHYRADSHMIVDDSAWKRTPGMVKDTIVAAVLEESGTYATDAAAAGGFEAEDAHLTRSRLVLDEKGWSELSQMLKHVLDRSDEIQKESEERLKKSEHQGERRSGLVMMLFDEMPAVPEPHEAANAVPAKDGQTTKARVRATAR
jgi:DNA-binding transcriptional ArsR family regulator